MTSGSSRRAPSGMLLRPISNHPHTSKIDAESEAASSMRASVLSRSLALREHASSASMARDDRNISSASSVRSVARSTVSRATTSTVPASQIRRSGKGQDGGISPAKRLANHVRAKDKAKERPDSKLTPSIVEPEGDEYVDEGESEYGYREREPEYDDESDEGDSDREEQEDRMSLDDNKTEQDIEEAKHSRLHPQTPVKKVLITRASLASVKSAAGTPTNDSRLKSSSASIKSQSTLRSSAFSPSSSLTTSPRPNSRGSTRSSRLNIATGTGPRTRPVPRPVSRLSTASTSIGGSTKGSSRPASSVSTTTTTTTDTMSTFCTATNGSTLSTPTATRSRRPSATSSVLLPTQRSSSGSSSVQERARKLSGASVSSIASNAGSIRSKTPAGTRGRRTASSGTESGKLVSSPAKLSPQPIHTSTSKGSVMSTISTGSSSKKPVPVGTLGRKSIAEKKSIESIASRQVPTPVAPVSVPQAKEEESKFSHGVLEKENVQAIEQNISELPASSSSSSAGTIRLKTVSDTANEHKKTNSSASTSSVATLKRKASTETIKTLKSSITDPATTSAIAPRPVSKALPPPPTELTQSPLTTQSPFSYQPTSIEHVLSEYVPRGATLDVGIPCIISSKRKRFKAYARYIGEVEGEAGPWVGVEVPMPIGDNWGDNDNTNKFVDDRQWHDGSWGGIRYFEVGGMGSEMDYGDDRASRRRRLDVSGGSLSESYFVRNDGKGLLKREGDQLSITSDRMKRMRSASPAVSDMSGTESKGLFVRPSQVLYVVDAVGADL